MIRSKLQVTVFANTHDEMIRKVNRTVADYLELSIDQITDHADVEIEIKETIDNDDFDFIGIAYVRIK